VGNRRKGEKGKKVVLDKYEIITAKRPLMFLLQRKYRNWNSASPAPPILHAHTHTHTHTHTRVKTLKKFGFLEILSSHIIKTFII
jgi:hypothetical protein